MTGAMSRASALEVGASAGGALARLGVPSADAGPELGAPSRAAGREVSRSRPSRLSRRERTHEWRGRPVVRAFTRAAPPASLTPPTKPATAVATADGPNDANPNPDPVTGPGVPLFAAGAASNRSSGHALARATGGARGVDATGRSTVVFPRAPSQTAPRGAQTARYIARQIELGPELFNGDVASSSEEANVYDGEGFDELYDRVLSRLRRDLIVERERRGDLTGRFFRQ